MVDVYLWERRVRGGFICGEAVVREVYEFLSTNVVLYV